MSRKRCEQGRGKIGIEIEVVTQLRDAQIFRTHVGTAEAEWRFTPVINHERLRYDRLGNVTDLIVVNDLHKLQLPSLCFRMIQGAGRDIIRHDVVLRVLLHNMHGRESVLSGLELLNKPGAVVRSIPENLGEQANLTARLRIFQEGFARIIRVRGEGIIQNRARHSREQTNQEERRGETGQADTGGEHRDDFVRPGHPAETEKQAEQERHWQQNHKNLRRLREIVFRNQRPRNALIQKRREVVADIEDEPDRDETRDAVKICLQKMTQDIAIEQSHEEFGNLEFRFAI